MPQCSRTYRARGACRKLHLSIRKIATWIVITTRRVLSSVNQRGGMSSVWHLPEIHRPTDLLPTASYVGCGLGVGVKAILANRLDGPTTVAKSCIRYEPNNCALSTLYPAVTHAVMYAADHAVIKIH